MKKYTHIDDIDHLPSWIKEAKELKKNPLKDQELGKNKTIGLLFFNSSLRTRLSTQKAALNLGMNPIVMNISEDAWGIEFGNKTVMNGSTAEHIKEAAAVVSQYCDVIIRQTNDLRRIVDEFSKFARMPEPIKRPTNVTKLLKDVILLFQVSSPKISIVFNNLYDDFNVSIDETMINQAFTNLIKNAGEAIESKLNSQPDLKFDPEIRITIDQIMNDLEITIEDNGIGLPNQERSRLFEPYVTNRENGTGLGLSIVKKIIEEHNGSLELLDASPFSKTDSFGAKMRIVFPKEIIIEN